MTCGDNDALEAKWAADKMYYAARFAWKRRNRKVDGKHFTWGQWFAKKFGENLIDYAERKSKERSGVA